MPQEHSGGTQHSALGLPLVTHGGHYKLPSILRLGIGAAFWLQAEWTGGFACGNIQGEELK